MLVILLILPIDLAGEREEIRGLPLEQQAPALEHLEAHAAVVVLQRHVRRVEGVFPDAYVHPFSWDTVRKLG